MLSKREIDLRLFTIHSHRSWFSLPLSLIVFCVSVFIHREILFVGDPWGWSPLALTCLGIFVSLILYKNFYTQFSEGNKTVHALNILAYLLTGAGWGLHFSQVIHFYGINSVESMACLFLLGGIIASGALVLMAHRPSFYAFSMALFLEVALAYFFTEGSKGSLIISYIGIYAGVIFLYYEASHFQLRKGIELEIKAIKERAKYKKLLDAVPGYVAFFDQEMRYLDCNEALKTLLPSIKDKRLGDIDPDSDHILFLQDFYVSGKKSEVKEVYFRKLNSWILLHVHRMDDGGCVVVGTPMNELIEVRKKVQSSSKLASLGEMAAGIAHEINNPLTIIHGASLILENLLQQDDLDRENALLLTSKISKTAMRMSKTVKGLKLLSRAGEKDPFVPTSISQVIEYCVELCHTRLKGTDIEVRMPIFPSGLSVMGREVQLTQVLVNLLNNAIDAVKTAPERWIEISFETSADWVDIFIKDSGNGIPEELSEKIMEPFFTTK